MKNKKLEAILDTIKLRDENGKIYPISDELMLQYIINFLTQKPLEAIIMDRAYIRSSKKEKIIECPIYDYYIKTIFEIYSNSPRRLRLYDNLSDDKKQDIEYFLKEISYIPLSSKIEYAINFFEYYFLGENYFSDLRQIVTEKEILNRLMYHAFVLEYSKDIAYLEFVPSEFDAKIKEKRKSLVNPEEMNELIKTIIEKGTPELVIGSGYRKGEARRR